MVTGAADLVHLAEAAARASAGRVILDDLTAFQVDVWKQRRGCFRVNVIGGSCNP